MQSDNNVIKALNSACQSIGTPAHTLQQAPEKETPIFQQLAKQHDLKFIPPQHLSIQHVILELPYQTSIWNHSLPIQINEFHGWIAANIEELEKIKQHLSLMQIKMPIYITCPTTLYALINKVKHQRFFQKLSLTKQVTEDNDIIDCVEHMLSDAVESRASDIHIEPQQQNIRVRLRVDGLLQQMTTLPTIFIYHIISRIKILAELNIAEKRLPQDGRFPFHRPDQSFDCRVSFCPSQYGEKIVIRLLNHYQKTLSLNTLGISETVLNTIKPHLAKPQGLVLITGPTGSGKTQTLYSILDYLQRDNINISTIEDPIEIPLPGITQTAVNPKINLHFSSILRSLLRQDPDIIMIGEIRDKETAEIAIRAAQTGHLVLTTLHTNNTLKTLHRLINMGIEPYHLVGCINLIICQRLVRKLCPFCKTAINDKDKSLTEQALNVPLYHHTIYKAGSCSQCSNGFHSREGIFEISVPSASMQQAILNLSLPIENETLTLQDIKSNGLKKVKQGITTLEEVKRVTDME